MCAAFPSVPVFLLPFPFLFSLRSSWVLLSVFLPHKISNIRESKMAPKLPLLGQFRKLAAPRLEYHGTARITTRRTSVGCVYQPVFESFLLPFSLFVCRPLSFFLSKWRGKRARETERRKRGRKKKREGGKRDGQHKTKRKNREGNGGHKTKGKEIGDNRQKGKS